MNRPKATPGRVEVLICLIIVLATVFAFWQLKGNDFVVFDDGAYIVENPIVRNGLSLEGLKWAFTTTHASNWHPLTWLSHMLDCQLFGLDPGWHHLMNLFFHLLNAALLFWLLMRLTGSVWCSALAAALFALHPLHVESVAWASERKDVLSTLFWLLTMGAYLCYVRRPGPLRYVVVFVFLALGLMAKPMLVTLPVVLLILDYWPLGRMTQETHINDTRATDAESPGVRLRRFAVLALEKAPLIALSAASSAITLYAQKTGGAMKPLWAFPVSLRLSNAAVSYGAYLKKMVWPAKLSIFYPLVQHTPSWQVFFSLAFLLALTLLALALRRSMPFLIVGWLWYLITLLPVIGLVQVGLQAMADRYTYVPLIGPFIMVAWSTGWAAKKSRGLGAVLVFLGVFLLVVLAGLTRLQVAHWRNSVTLFSHAISVTKNNYLAHNNLGAGYLREGRITEAETHFKEALKIFPRHVQALNNLGAAAHMRGRAADAVDYYLRALKISQHYPAAHYNLGLALADLGRFNEAVAHLREAVRLNPLDIRSLIKLGLVLEDLGRMDEAVKTYTDALRLDPNNAQAHNNLGVALAKGGDFEKALGHFSRAVNIDPGFLDAYSNWGNALVSLGRVQEAISRYEKALDIDPGFAEAHNNLGVALLRSGRLEEALGRFEKALALNPQYEDARENKRLCLGLMEKPAKPPRAKGPGGEKL